MTAASSTLPPCPLPGCTSTTEQVGKPCSGCQAAFGGVLREVAGSDIDPETYLAEQHKRDDVVRSVLAGRALATMTPYERRVAGVIRKPNQRCWLCEERRTCVLTEQGWVCANCKEE